MRLVAALFGLLAVIAPQVSAQISSAHAVLHPFYNSTTANTASPLFGTVDFYQNNDGSGLVNITVKIAGLQANKNYSLHVHQFGNLAGFLSDILTSTILTTNTTLSNVGPHFNPFNQAHGCGVGSARHAGDVGNVSIPDGTAETAWTTVYLQSELLDLGINNTFSYDSIIGRAVVLREFADACDETQLGGYLAVGVIGINDTNSKAVADAQPTDATNSAPKAVALIFNTISQKPVGYINFWTDAKNGTHMSGVVSGFPPRSVHGIHVHASGNEDTNITIGTHWTGPTGTSHGLPPFNNRHWGDLGNVIADSKGVITFQDMWAPLNLISVWNSTNSILGRAIAIHEGKDDGTVTTYGPRYNFGVIGLADTLFQLPGVPAPEYPTVARAQVILRAFYNNTNATTSGTWPDAPLVGNITFTQNVDGTGDVNVTVVVAGLRGGASGRDYGLHIHDWGNEFNSFDHTTGARITNLTALANAVDPNLGGVGPHFNPFLQPHGCGYGNFARHAGDIGNVSVAANGDADRFTFFTYQLKSELLDLGRNQYNNDSIIGRTITLHDRPNPCDGTVPLGNWIAIGVIGIDSTNIGTLKEQNVAQQEQLPFNPNNNSPKANAVIRDFRGNNGAGQIVGDIFFWSGQNGEIRMGGAVAGFPPGSSHGVHIHQFGNENNNLTIGPHWAAPGQDGNEFHQLPPYAGRHFGDVIGNVTADANGVISFMNVTAGFDLLSLTTAANSIIGHSIAFHEFVDDGNSVTPSYGPRYKFGVIGMVHPDFPIPTSFNAIVFPPAGSTSSPGTTTAPPSTNGTTTAPPITNGTTTAPPITNGTTTSPPTNGTGTTTVPPTGKPPNAAHTISSTIANLVAALLAVAVVALL